MKRLESMHAITTAYTRLQAIDDDKALRREKLTLADYHSACATFKELTTPGAAALNFSQPVADFFARCGYNVTPAGVNFRISC